MLYTRSKHEEQHTVFLAFGYLVDKKCSGHFGAGLELRQWSQQELTVGPPNAGYLQWPKQIVHLNYTKNRNSVQQSNEHFLMV